MGSNVSRERIQTDDSNGIAESFPSHRAPTQVASSPDEPRKKLQDPKSNNNNNSTNHKPREKKQDTTLDSDMHFIVDTFESVEKMTTNEKSKRRRWLRRNKEKDDTKNKPIESTSAPSRLPKSPKLDNDNTQATGILAKGKQFILRRQPAIKPRTAPSTSTRVESEENEDEWQCPKIVIDGFDPEKFKQANAAKKSEPNSLETQTLSSVRPNGDPLILRIRSTELHELAVPSAFDSMDEQLMSTIEKEFKNV